MAHVQVVETTTLFLPVHVPHILQIQKLEKLLRGMLLHLVVVARIRIVGLELMDCLVQVIMCTNHILQREQKMQP